ncbi:thiamine pyrophosphate-dependent enzyme [Terrilactibacillus sp. S3-3]|nr:thiamine pyrophosphate-dependent enzyme [Terrilactibacillus sp. S3-3]
MAVYPNVLIQDLLEEFPLKACPSLIAMPKLPFPYDENTLNENKPLSAKDYYPEIQQMIKEDDIVITESGTFAWGLAQVKLKGKVTYLAQGGWGSIGYALPAAFGAYMAAPKRRVLLFTGEGSLQINVQELSSMLDNGCKLIIFVLNNKGYTIEKEINQPSKTDYNNNIPNWDYQKLPEAFGREAYTVQVRTNKAFHDAVIEAEKA